MLYIRSEYNLSHIRTWPGVFGISWGRHQAAHLSSLGNTLFLHAADAGNRQPGEDNQKKKKKKKRKKKKERKK